MTHSSWDQPIPELEPLRPDSSEPRSLLIVDDDAVELEIINDTLAHAFPGAEISSTSDGLLAAEMCIVKTFDCVLLDYNMPLIDGLTLAKELRASSPYLPIVLMTSVGDEMLAALALRSGASDYIPKSRINADSIRRTFVRAIHTSTQARLIDEQRGELETFAYALAHDFKQPIRQITTFAQMISDEIPADRAAAVHQHLDFLGTAARRLSKLVDVMSQYTLLNQPPEIDDIDLDMVVKAIEVSIAPYLNERAVELVWNGRSSFVRGNETLMGQVLQNLILNGFQYNQSPKPRVEVTVRETNEHCTIRVRDNGIGIESAYMADIFKPLVRLHTTTEYPGTGLGLTLARKAIIAQGGSIWCESEPGKGSTFYVKLARARREDEPICVRPQRRRA
jgi:signal transduction histidine kinase